MSDQFASAPAFVLLVFALTVALCAPAWFWILTVRRRRKRARLAHQLWWSEFEEQVRATDFSKITAGTVTADRIEAGIGTTAETVEAGVGTTAQTIDAGFDIWAAFAEARAKAEGRGDV